MEERRAINARKVPGGAELAAAKNQLAGIGKPATKAQHLFIY